MIPLTTNSPFPSPAAPSPGPPRPNPVKSNQAAIPERLPKIRKKECGSVVGRYEAETSETGRNQRRRERGQEGKGYRAGRGGAAGETWWGPASLRPGYSQGVPRDLESGECSGPNQRSTGSTSRARGMQQEVWGQINEEGRVTVSLRKQRCKPCDDGKYL